MVKESPLSFHNCGRPSFCVYVICGDGTLILCIGYISLALLMNSLGNRVIGRYLGLSV